MPSFSHAHFTWMVKSGPRPGRPVIYDVPPLAAELLTGDEPRHEQLAVLLETFDETARGRLLFDVAPRRRPHRSRAQKSWTHVNRRAGD
jgi:hypothetical protein